MTEDQRIEILDRLHEIHRDLTAGTDVGYDILDLIWDIQDMAPRQGG